jgi:hypothetical protein
MPKHNILKLYSFINLRGGVVRDYSTAGVVFSLIMREMESAGTRKNQSKCDQIVVKKSWLEV